MMRAGTFLDLLRSSPVQGLAHVARGRGIVVVAPHQDDESLGCGGLIAQAALLGLDVRIVFISDGAGSHPNSQAYPPDRLRALRQAEACSAALILGLPPEKLSFLRLPDRHVPHDGADAAEAVRCIASLVDECHASMILTSWIEDPHCDHKAAFHLSVAAARQAAVTPDVHAYVVWGWTLAPDTEIGQTQGRGWRLDVSAQSEVKARAIAAHASQLTDMIDDDPSAFRLDEEMLERFRGRYEYFIEVSHDAQT